MAEERHFTRAAKRLRIAQPALSRQIRDLEEELGCTLLYRQARAITLTAAGEVLLLEARNVIMETERLKEATKRASNGQAGQISIGYVSWIVPKFLLPLLRAIRQNSPALEIDVKEMTPFDQIQALSNDRLHLGFAKFLVTHSPEGTSVAGRSTTGMAGYRSTTSLTTNSYIYPKRILQGRSPEKVSRGSEAT